MPFAALAYAARILPSLALVAAVWLGVLALRQHATIAELNTRYSAGQASLVQCQQDAAAAYAAGQALQAKALTAAAAARQARAEATKALTAAAARPLAPTCQAAITELTEALGGGL